ncbi:MAG: T9SS type A sorting domain-containing protein [Arachidicoccus sp.]|nr:T9SS type A sorting domain-containing protein [Arachidicoccus sp.]
MRTLVFIKCRHARLKCIMFSFMSLIGIQQSHAQAYFNSDTTLASGIYNVSGWAAGTTITIPAGNTVTINCAYGNGNLIINGTLNLSATSFGMAGTLTLGADAVCTTAGSAQFQGARTYGAGSQMTVNGTMTVADVPLNMYAKSAAIVHGDYTNNISSSGTNNISLYDSARIVADGNIVLNGSHLQLDTRCLVKSGANMNFNNGNSTISGNVVCGGTLKFSTPNIILNCANVTTVNLDNEAESGTLSGTGLIVVTGSFTGDGNSLTNSSSIVLNAANIGTGGNPGSATIGTTGPCTQSLPILLSAFDAAAYGTSIKLSWITITELNNKGFAIERSANGNDYTQIAFIDSKAANGNSSVPLNYTYTDSTPLPGYNYYRLRQEDINDISAYYVLKQPVRYNGTSISIYPSPATSTLNIVGIDVNSKYSIRILNINGKALLTSTTNKIDITSLAAGIYFVQIVNDNNIEKVFKFIKE